MSLNIEYHECGCCGHYHEAGFTGECRNDKERFSYEDLDTMGIPAEQIIGIDEG